MTLGARLESQSRYLRARRHERFADAASARDSCGLFTALPFGLGAIARVRAPQRGKSSPKGTYTHQRGHSRFGATDENN